MLAWNSKDRQIANKLKAYKAKMNKFAMGIAQKHDNELICIKKKNLRCTLIVSCMVTSGSNSYR